MNAYFDAMRRYFDFKTRASRTEFWKFTLVVFVGGIIALIVDLALGNGQNGPLFITALWVIPHYIPALAVAVRRLHDIDRTGWWVLIGVIPIGALILIVFYCRPSTPGANRFGSGRANNAAQSPIQARQQANAGLGIASLDQLERLAALRASGAIDEAEFQRMKAETAASRA